MEDTQVRYCSNYLETDEQQTLYQQLLRDVSWQQDSISLFGQTHLIPREQYWMADAGADYSYSGLSLKANQWHPLVAKLKDKLAEDFDTSFNSVLLNHYRNGQDSNGWHSDNEPELGAQPIIASISLGAVRDFRFRHKQSKRSITLPLEPGSLLWMQGNSQADWEHCLPKRAKADSRINLTFRQIL